MLYDLLNQEITLKRGAIIGKIIILLILFILATIPDYNAAKKKNRPLSEDQSYFDSIMLIVIFTIIEIMATFYLF